MASTLEFANFTLTFGAKAVMADYLSDIVLPAFLDKDLRRTYGESSYFFLYTQMLQLGPKEDQPSIAGAFVKDTVLRREQVYDPSQGLVRDKSSINSSPSATFVLLLNNHRLLYLHDTAHAPDLQTFRATAANFLMKKYLTFVTSRQAALAAQGKSISRVRLKEEMPPPDLSVIALSDDRSLKQFIEQYDILKSVTLEFGAVNAELANDDDFFRQVQEQRLRTGADRAALTERKATGLNKAAVVKQAEAATALGNARVRFAGTAPGGVTLRGTNEEVKLKVTVGNLPPEVDGKPDITGKAERMYSEFVKLFSQNLIKLPKQDDNNVAKIRDAIKDKR